MKTLKYIGITLALALTLNACDQEIAELENPTPPAAEPDCPAGASAGEADFSKFVAVGNSLVAGVQGASLFTEGQENSLPAIIHNQLECVGAPDAFVQPSINASLGWNLFSTQAFLADQTKPVLGRLLLQYGTEPDCSGAIPVRPTPQAYQPGELEALPNPAANSGFIYTGEKTELNNFGFPMVLLGQSLIPQTGDWSLANLDPRFNPYYGRLKFPGNGSTIINDVAAAQPTFFLFWLGMDDYFLHAALGGDPSLAPLTSPTGGLPAGFDGQYAAAVGSLLMSNTELKGVVGNFPDVFVFPHFTSVAYNPVPLTATQVEQLNVGFGGYNAALSGLIANKAAFGISDELAAQIESRKVSFEASCTNKVLLIDETLVDLGPYFDGLVGAGAINETQRAQLAPYQRVRQSTPADIMPLATGSVLGTPGTFGLMGISEPLPDRWVILPAEKEEINAARLAYNQIVAGVVANSGGRLALADVNTAFNNLFTSKFASVNQVTITPNINPPTGIFSEDGVHPNARGYAFLANVFIDAINTGFDASIPKANISKYKATGLPVNP
jgi:lysophospholipase L1-like esterase